jgi:signal transduction histidine kinase
LRFSSGVGRLELYNGKELPLGDDLFSQVVYKGETLFFEDGSAISPESTRNPFTKNLTQDLRACVISPLKKERIIVGLLILGYYQPHEFSENQVRLIAAISDMAGSALHRMSATEMLEKMAADRNRVLDSIYQVTSAASKSIDLNSAAFQRALGLILKAVHANTGAIFLLNNETQFIEMVVDEGMSEDVRRKMKVLDFEYSPEGWVIRNNKFLLLPNLTSDVDSDRRIQFEGGQVYASFPLCMHDRAVGALSISRTGDQQFNLEEITLLTFIANHLGLIVENVQLFKQEEHHALLEERSRMARELHDSIIQAMFSAGLFTNGALDAVKEGSLEKVRSNLKQSSKLIQQALIEMRLMIYELRSQVLADKGLIAALNHRLDSVERRSGITVDFLKDDVPELNAKVEDGLYRTMIEVLNNAFKHAQADHLHIEIRHTDHALTAVVKDNGIGFDPILAAQNGGIGFSSMRERVEKLDGSLNIVSSPGNGAQVTISIPIEEFK